MYNLINLFYTVKLMVYPYLIIITKPKTKPKTIEIMSCHMKRNVHQKLTFVGIRALTFRYSEAKPWHNALLRHLGNLNNDKSLTTEP